MNHIAIADRKPKLLGQTRQGISTSRCARRSEEAYVHWIKRFVLFYGKRHPVEMGGREINAFLTNMAVKKRVSASTQIQALSAWLSLYRYVLWREITDLGEVISVRRPTRLHVVMTHKEVNAVLSGLYGDRWPMALPMYGAGLRLMEGFRLRVEDVDFVRNEILIRGGRGAKHRVTMVPVALKRPLQAHLRGVKGVHEKDLADGWRCPTGWGVGEEVSECPSGTALAVGLSGQKPWSNERAGKQGRHHVAESIVHNALKEAVAKAGLARRATCHTVRHSFARHLIEAGYDIRTLQELLGHKGVRTTMVYRHVLNRGGRRVKSPVDDS